MEGLIGLFSIVAIIALGIAIWMNTKRGKKWLSNL